MSRLKRSQRERVEEICLKAAVEKLRGRAEKLCLKECREGGRSLCLCRPLDYGLCRMEISCLMIMMILMTMMIRPT